MLRSAEVKPLVLQICSTLLRLNFSLSTPPFLFLHAEGSRAGSGRTCTSPQCVDQGKESDSLATHCLGPDLFEHLKKIKKQNHGTQDSRVVPHRGTNWAALWLTAQIGRDAVLSESYGRG